MSAAGISVANDLAIVVVLTPRPVVAFIFTPSDGRAFRGCAYFKSWISNGLVYTHDPDVPLDFSRVLADVCRTHHCRAVGFNPEQVPLRADGLVEGVPVTNDHSELEYALMFLNSAARGYDGFLYPENSPMQFMWASLPVDADGNRCLPTAENPATGRIDGAWAVLHAVIAGGYSGRAERIDRQKESDRMIAVDALRAYPFIWIKHPFHGVLKARPTEPRTRDWLETGEAVFIKIAEPWEVECPQNAR